jgi:beta-glucosidase/6-phospho-beta-glucosidase/beta-galactosidase
MLLFFFILLINLYPIMGLFIGTATSAYQVEGHLPGNSIWDTFTSAWGSHAGRALEDNAPS